VRLHARQRASLLNGIRASRSLRAVLESALFGSLSYVDSFLGPLSAALYEADCSHYITVTGDRVGLTQRGEQRLKELLKPWLMGMCRKLPSGDDLPGWMMLTQGGGEPLMSRCIDGRCRVEIRRQIRD